MLDRLEAEMSEVAMFWKVIGWFILRLVYPKETPCLGRVAATAAMGMVVK